MPSRAVSSLRRWRRRYYGSLPNIAQWLPPAWTCQCRWALPAGLEIVDRIPRARDRGFPCSSPREPSEESLDRLPPQPCELHQGRCRDRIRRLSACLLQQIPRGVLEIAVGQMLEPLGSALVGYQAIHLRAPEQEPSLYDLHHLAQRLMIVAKERSFQNALHQGALRRRQCIQLRRKFSDLARMLDLAVIRQPLQAARPHSLNLWRGAAVWNLNHQHVAAGVLREPRCLMCSRVRHAERTVIIRVERLGVEVA